MEILTIAVIEKLFVLPGEKWGKAASVVAVEEISILFSAVGQS